MMFCHYMHSNSLSCGRAKDFSLYRRKSEFTSDVNLLNEATRSFAEHNCFSNC